MKRFIIPLILIALVTLSAQSLLGAQFEPDSAQKLANELARRENILFEAVRKAYTPPAAGVMVHPDEIPMGNSWEDPDWDSPLVQSIYKNPYSYGNNLDNYRPCLEEALGGNPKAMLALSMYCYLWSHALEEEYPDFPPDLHSPDFWRDWAERITGPAWVSLRLGDLHGRWPDNALEYYRQAAELGNAEAMYNYYKISGKRPDYLWRSAALGHAKAAFLLSEELVKQGGGANADLSKRYIWLAALNTDEWGLLNSSFAFYNGEFPGLPASCERGYLYALLAGRYQHGNIFFGNKPDNICLLQPEVISRLEAMADRWQADYDQQRLLDILRVRYKSAPHVEALQNQLSPVMEQLGVKRFAPGEFFNKPAVARSYSLGGRKLDWHLGFYIAGAVDPASYSGVEQGDAYSSKEYQDDNDYIMFLVYTAVICIMLFGAALIMYGKYAQRRKALKLKGRSE